MKRWARWSALLVGVVVALLVGLLATRPSATTLVANSPLVGRAAPEIAGTSIDGERTRLSGMRGRWVVVNFFATWCIPCQREHPELIKFSQRHMQADDARVLAVIFDDEVSGVRKFFEAKGGDWPVLPDPTGKVSLDLGVRGPPESYLVDPNGVIRAKIVGEVTADGLDRLLREVGA